VVQLKAESTRPRYEDNYSEALRVLQDRYAFVGPPYLTPQGKRLCDVEGLAADDHTVLLLAWGPELTDQIEEERNSECAARSHSDGSGPVAEGAIDQEWISGFLLRWIMAEQFLAFERTEGVPEERAVQVLIKRDIPILLSALAQSRPELSFRAVT
jgi:hypothetical protein